MATTTNKSPPYFFFFFLILLSLALLSAKAQQRQIEGCAPFSCGQLQDISYPFRRRDDPPQCGEARYQLNCQDNKSTISIGSVEYLVTYIHYISYYDDWMLRLVDPNFVGGGSCALPSQSLSPETLHRLGYWQDYGQWASFMKCSKPIENDRWNYWPVSCLNNRYNSPSFVYAFIADDGYESYYLSLPCEFISGIPLTDGYNPGMIKNSTSSFFSILDKGFILSTLEPRPIKSCPSFSCGQLQDISYPFRRRDDPPQCGEARYQLSCQSNKSTLSINSVEYLVTDILYDYYNYWTLRLVDPNFVGSGSCALPSQSLSVETLYRLGYWQDIGSWAIFMKCSQPIANDGWNYWPVSCLSSHYNSSFVYVIIQDDGFEFRYLPPPCEFISRIPMTDNYDRWMIQEMNQTSTANFFSILKGGFTLGLLQQRPTKSCPPFSCGQLQNISYPFRRRDDPPYCGEASYQLNCLGNKSTISIRSVDYLVTEIQQNYYYYYYSQGQTSGYCSGYLHLVDPNFVGGGSCGLPSKPLSLGDTRHSLEEWQNWGSWASFMNCSKPIQTDSRYWPVSCINSRYSSSFVYVFIDGNELQYLPPPCQFISMIPMAGYYYSWMIQNSTPDIFSILQEGFILNFDTTQITHIKFGDCLKEYSPIGLTDFEYCLQRYFNHTVPYNIITIVLVFIHTLAILIVLLIVARLVAAPIIIWLLVIYKVWSIKRQDAIDTVEKFLRHQQTLIPTRYTYTDIIAITRHFKEKLGQGGFGSVFKGELAGGILVAVKMMGSSKCNGDEFINEVSTIGRIHHVNVVRLVGYCSDGSKRALIYEYMPNGSLDKYIFSNKNRTNLHTFTSEKLIDIAMGIARGINYLHCGCDMQILHFDIKPHNILLDRNFTPKISDFGLARLYPKDNSLVSISATRGTIGYIAPELISRSFGAISKKSDVYSYGMLLMEMAGRRRNVDPLIGNSSQVYYPSWIYDKLNQQQEIILENNFEISELEKKLAIIGLWCIQMKSFERPIMSKVIEMLESEVEAIPMPPKPFFSSMESILENKMHLDSISTELSIISE